MVRVVGCCLCLQALIILHGCLWVVVAVCALFKVVDGGGVHLVGVVVGDGCVWQPLLMTEATVAR